MQIPEETERGLVPLGATLEDGGASFAVYSSRAAAIELCVAALGGVERRIALDRDGDLWQGHVRSVGPGDRYAFRVHGPPDWRPGERFDPATRLIDPYARAIDGSWSVLVDPAFDWQGDRPPATPIDRTVIYEAHVRGLTRTHPDVPPELRGTYAGLAEPAVLAELVSLGVTAIELLPVHHFVSEQEVVARGLTNYWGYSTIGFFAPHAAYAATAAVGGQVAEFREMVRRIHAAGLEVILDVVFNHTAEGRINAPALSFRGLDDHAYYRRANDDPGRYDDLTGTGNTLDTRAPVVERLVLDALRYWVQEMHVDGFRFDLMSALARGEHGFDPGHPLLARIAADPVLATTKLIAEAWDATPEGYAVGRFPPPWADWNGTFRDTVRDFWRGRGTTGDLARALSGSSATYEASGRGPLAAINFVTCHDGFTLRDLVSYDHKHNEANCEGDRDGEGYNRSWNSGIEGLTSDADVQDLRRRRASALLATVFLSAGVPMLAAGDERWRTQHGNNNAYCHDGPLTWLDWQESGEADSMRELTARLAALRREHAVLRRPTFFDGDRGDGSPVDVRWLSPDGRTMGGDWWQDAHVPTLGALLDGRASAEPSTTLLICTHAGDAPTAFHLPDDLAPAGYDLLLDTSRPGGAPAAQVVSGSVEIPDWSVLVLRPRATIDLT